MSQCAIARIGFSLEPPGLASRNATDRALFLLERHRRQQPARDSASARGRTMQMAMIK
jgi:hypothetical protein